MIWTGGKSLDGLIKTKNCLSFITKLDITYDKESCSIINVHSYPKRKQRIFITT